MSDTEISDALRASLSYRVAASVTRSLDAAVRGIHQRSRREGRGSLAAVQASRSFRSLAACVSGIHRLQGIMRAAGARSALFGGGTGRVLPLARALAKLDRWLVLIPFNFLFLDYAIRDLGPLQAFSNIWDEAALLCLAVYVVLRPLWLETSYRLRWGDLDWLVVLFIGLGVGLLGFVSPEPAVAIEGFRAVFQHVLWYFVIRQLVTSANRSMVYRSVVVMGLFLGWHALYQIATGARMPGAWVDATENINTRAFSIIGSPNILAAVFVLTTPIVATVALTKDARWVRVLSVLALPAMTLGLLFTYSRQAYLALAGAAGVFLVLFYPKAVKYLVVALGAVLVVFKSVADRLLYLFSPEYFALSSKAGRVVRYQYAVEQWLDKPWFGQGLGRFGGAVATHNNLTPFYVDSYYLKTLGEMGAVGLVGMLALFTMVLVKVKRLIQAQRHLKDALALSGVFVGLLGVVLQNAVENVFEVPMMLVLFWGFVAVAMSYDGADPEAAEAADPEDEGT